ncbi:CPBP family intramembrane metalloprotease domain-containing protein [Haloarcula mannanilytica]|uniref:CPBP family intramembrane metalloprotease domain-containing protein n=1 Tax=Haloarcula mannanilytica TaxID=2509225 RepID=A0A4C2EFS4_9EURY|nr:CPBP family intramembrane glutamic endopeptidase [Haloarcula mannanilytica]GCF13295.1 CPBP family intramembrane metalloprotease domain-containing protein [Haloarcula mannanilytica]
MDDTAANWGVLAAGIGLVVLVATETGLVGWVTPTTGVGPVTARQVAVAGFVVAALAFSFVRHGALDRRQAGLAAVGASAIATLATLVAFFGPEFRPGVEATVGLAVYLTMLAGGITVALGWALSTGVANNRLYTVARALSVATGIGLAGFLVGTLFAQFVVLGAALVGLISSGALDGGTVTGPAYITLTVGIGVGFVGFGAAVASQLDRTWDDLDLRRPGLRDIGYGVGGVVVLMVALFGFSYIIQALGLEAARSSVEELAREDPSFLLVMMPLAFLTIAPSEEFIYRNIIQKYLYDDFSEIQAIVLTSAVFGIVHFGQYAAGTPTQTVLSLLLVFVLSTLLGLSYLKTENLLVPIFIHGAFNAIQFLTLYIQITGNPVI